MPAGREEIALPATLGRYQLLGRVAAGGAATVYFARMLGKAGFARTVAVKVLHKHLASDPEFVAGFLDEARLAARIAHPNVVDVYDVDAIAGQLIIVMAYVEGAALNWLVRRRSQRDERLPLGFCLRVVHDALRGLHAAHELNDERGLPLGLVHRDVSPHNILIGTDGMARVSDFGIAKAKGRIATTQGNNVVKGKLRYLAPEQFKRVDLDRRVDVFAAGIVLWETLVGEPLFTGDTEEATLAALITEPITPPSKLRSEVPKKLDTICLRALERDRDKRYATAAELADAIDDELGSLLWSPRKVGALVKEDAAARIDQTREIMSQVATPTAGPVRGSVPTLPEILAETPHGTPATPSGSGSPMPAARPSDTTLTGVTPATQHLLGGPRPRWQLALGGAALVGLGGFLAWMSMSGQQGATPAGSAAATDGAVSTAVTPATAASNTDEAAAAAPPSSTANTAPPSSVAAASSSARAANSGKPRVSGLATEARPPPRPHPTVPQPATTSTASAFWPDAP